MKIKHRLPTKTFTRLSLVAALSAPGAALYSPQAVACGCPCWQAAYEVGYNFADQCCTSSITSAFQSVNEALVESEQDLLDAMGMGTNMAKGDEGFPGLESTIEAAEGQATKSIVTALELTTKKLAAEIRKVPALQAAFKAEKTRGKGAINFPERTDATMRMGKALGIGGGNNTQTTLGFLANQTPGYDVSGPDQDADSPSDSPAGLPTKNAAGKGIMPTDLKNQARAQQAQLLTQLREVAEENEQTLTALINGNLLIGGRHQTIPRPEQEQGLADGDIPTAAKLDLLTQVLVDGQPASYNSLSANTLSFSDVVRGNESRLHFLRQSIVAAIMGRHSNMRKAHPASLGGEQYILESIGQSVDGPISDEAFMNLMATRRVKDPEIISVNGVSSRHAAIAAAQMEAEHLYMKYQRYLTKRETNLALAQVLAHELRAERQD